MKENKKTIDKEKLQAKVRDLIEKSKKMNMIKPLSTAFETTPCKSENHKGSKAFFTR